jgi:hypothetical protein
MCSALDDAPRRRGHAQRPRRPRHGRERPVEARPRVAGRPRATRTPSGLWSRFPNTAASVPRGTAAGYLDRQNLEKLEIGYSINASIGSQDICLNPSSTSRLP